MNMKVKILSVCLLIPLLALASAAPAQSRFRAVSLTLWGGGGGTPDEHPLTMANLNTTDLSLSLDAMQAAGVDTVGVNVFWLQDNINSNQISPDPTGATGFKGTATTGVTETVIDAIHARGMDVMLKPLVNLRNDPGHWRGQINGTSSWFWGASGAAHDGTQVGGGDGPYDGYANFLYHWAEVAEAHDVEVLCIGTELATTTNTTWKNDQWSTMIEGPGGAGGVRGRFGGEITYAAQGAWSPNPPVASQITSSNIQFWDDVDYLGVDAYFPLTSYHGSNNDPSLATLQDAWESHEDRLAAWSAANGGKQVMFTETGYCSQDGTNKHPWQCGGPEPVDYQEQAECYEALLSTMWDETYWAGGFWWNWEIDPDPSDWNHAPVWFTPQGKPAEDVLASYYVPEPTTLALLAAGQLTLLRRRRGA